MEIDTDKIDETVLALLYLTQNAEWSAWKGHDWEALNRLYEKGMIDNPRSKRKAIYFSEEGLAESRRLFEKMFCKS